MSLIISSSNNTLSLLGSNVTNASGNILCFNIIRIEESTPSMNAFPFAYLSSSIFLSSDGPAATIIAGIQNTSSAESRIRDTDMASEMVEYSKNNILQQAGQSMLAQANQQTQGVVSLLQ